MTGYPWSDGQTLYANDLDAAFAAGQAATAAAQDAANTAKTIANTAQTAAIAAQAAASAATAADMAVNVLTAGAKGDGTTNDSPVIQAALNSMAATGGIVYCPPTGHPYILNTGLSVPNGVMLLGPATRNFAGVTATIAQWAAQGTWFQCNDLTNPAVTLAGHGAAIKGINFIYNQPIPGATWTPTIYPWAIDVRGDFCLVEDIMAIGASHGLQILYPAANGGGTGVNIRNLMLSCFVRGIHTDFVNDIICVDNVHVRNLFYSSTPAVTNYIYANLIGWDCGYTDNALVKGLEFFQCKQGFLFTDSTCLGATHSAWNWNVTDIQHFGATFCAVANSSVHVSGLWSNVQAQSDTFSGEVQTAQLFSFTSDNVDLSLSNLYVFAAGAGFTVGNGAGGRLLIDGLKVIGYSAVASGQTLFAINAGATFVLGSRVITKPGGAGQIIAGAGVSEIVSAHDMVWQVLPVQLASNVTANGSPQSICLANQFAPVTGGKYQAKISGVFQIVTPQSGGTASVSLSGFPEIAATGIAATSSANVAFDSNWVDISSASNIVGTVQVTATSGIVYNFSALTVQFR
jgi:hypothetical protein